MTFKDYRDMIHQMEREMQTLSDEMLRGFFDHHMGGNRFWSPALDISETITHVVVKVELAGVRPEDLHVSISGDDRALAISGVRRENPIERAGRTKCHHIEIYYGPFERVIPLPQGLPVDRNEIKAKYLDGFLVVHILKRPLPHEPMPVEIHVTTEDAAANNDDNTDAESSGKEAT
jgi:HSP20 family protein